MVRIIQYRKLCNGCNACVELDPARWRISKSDGKSILVGGAENNGFTTLLASDGEYELSKLAEQRCSLKVIRVHKV
ncbi:MAG: ferredoxin [Bacteroidia bacterium]|jgi:ferredoxin|nr:ferredoxin [Bacteroidia bacterium]